MYGKIALTAAALITGIGFQPAPADAKDGVVLVHGKGHGHGHHRGHRGHRRGHHAHRPHHRHGQGWKHRRANQYWRYSAPYWYGSHCYWKQRPYKVRVWDNYYGWRHKTVWRPVRICR